MKIKDLEKALQYFVIAVPESERQAKAYFWARKALAALRSMPEAGEPLSLEQLREMDGKPVWCEWLLEEDRKDETGAWFIVVKEKNKYGFELKKPLDFGHHVCKNENYGTGWLAYSYPPTHIDRSKWEPCEHCESSEYPPDYYGPHNFPIVENEIYFYDTDDGWEGEEINYCPWCDRPLTEEAWEELERRVRE